MLGSWDFPLFSVCVCDGPRTTLNLTLCQLNGPLKYEVDSRFSQIRIRI